VGYYDGLGKPHQPANFLVATFSRCRNTTGERQIWEAAKIGAVNLVEEHFGVVTMCSTTKFTVPIFAVFDVCVYNTCI